MKALSLWQPWATAIALGNKHVETRHWSTKYRGVLAIHASKRWERDQRDFAQVEFTLGRLPRQIAFGAIVAVARLVEVRPTEELKLIVGAIERLYGNYGPGRFGWVLQEITPLPEPIPCIGRQGLFNVPDQIVGRLTDLPGA